MNHSFVQRVNRVLFRSVNFNEVSEFANQGFRPYTANNDTKSIVDNAMNIIGERKYDMGRFSPSTIGSVTDGMIGMAGASMGNIGIDNGWNNRRYMFSINVDIQMSSGGSINYIVTGFTDTNNVSVNGQHVMVDPSIVLHITNIAEGQQSQNFDGSSGLFIRRSDQILTRQHYMNDINNTGTEFRSQRPIDVFSTMKSNMFKQDGGTKFINTETAMGTPVFGSRFNNIPNQYSANIFNSYVDAANANSEFAGDEYHPQVAELVNTESASEAYISNNKFLEFLNTNNDGFTHRTSFRWSDILAIDNTIMDRFHLNRLQDRESFLPSNGFITANTNNRSDILGQIAAVLGTSIPALANRCNLTIVSFVANNMFGQHNVTISYCESFNPLTSKQHGDQFEQLMPSQVLNSLFTSMGFTYELSVYCQVNSETFIKLRVNEQNQGRGEDFLFPTFAEALYTPTVTNNVETIDSISDTVKHVTTRIAEESNIGKSQMEAQNMRSQLSGNNNQQTFAPNFGGGFAGFSNNGSSSGF